MVWIVRSTLMSVRRHHAKTVLRVYSFLIQRERDSTYRRQRDTIASVLQDLQVRFIEVLIKIWHIPNQSQYPNIQLICCYVASTQYEANTLLPTAREGNVFTGVCKSFCTQSASWLLSHCSSLLWLGRYASYWNAFLLVKMFRLNESKIWVWQSLIHRT